MKQHSDGCIDWRIVIICFVMALVCSCATTEPLQQTTASGRRPIVILISGHSGPGSYRSYAGEVAKLGYYPVLLDGNNVSLGRGTDGENFLRHAIEQAQSSPQATPGKVVVIGFSMGGGGALAHATHMPDLVSAVVAYYPMTRGVADMQRFVARFQVPVLVLAGERDTYMNCCLIESMKAMEAAAMEGGKPFELVVFPKANHGFNLLASRANYSAEDAADAWQRTTKMLSQYQPLR